MSSGALHRRIKALRKRQGARLRLVALCSFLVRVWCLAWPYVWLLSAVMLRRSGDGRAICVFQGGPIRRNVDLWTSHFACITTTQVLKAVHGNFGRVSVSSMRKIDPNRLYAVVTRRYRRVVSPDQGKEDTPL